MNNKTTEVKLMPYVFVSSYVPVHRVAESAKIYVNSIKELNSKARPLRKEIIPNAVKSTMEGIETIGVHDVKEGKLDEFLKLLQEYMVNFHVLEGFKYKIEVRFNATEALAMIGLKLPE